MSETMTIGDFSRATRLSAKALRFYHFVGLLEPASIDPSSRYRFYATEQLDDARLIQHLRSLDMPVEEIKRVLTAPGPGQRRAAIADHLDRMEQRLSETRGSVAALRQLLAPAPTVIETRWFPATPALVIRDAIDLDELTPWFGSTSDRLRAVAARLGADAAGPLGGLWSTELFLDETGDCALFLPVSPTTGSAATGIGAVFEVLPASRMAVATHRGTDDTIGQTYTDLGAHVAEQGTSLPGPVREHYFGDAPTGEGITEIGWPVSGTDF